MRNRLSVVALSVLIIAASVGKAEARQAASGVTIDVESIRALLVTGFENNRAMDIDFVRAIPDSAFRWAPNEDVRDFAEQIEHTVLDNVLFVTMAVVRGERPHLESPKTYLNDKAALTDVVNAAYDWVLETLRSLPAQDMLAETELFGQSMTKWRVYLQALEHAYWTRGQLVPYFRAHGLAPPRYRAF